jgi:hypothetical protein
MKTLARPRDKAELLERLRRVRPDSARRWGRMSAHQMICHSSDAVRMATGEKVVRDASGFLQRTIVKWFALYFPLPWPPGIPTRPEIDPLRGGSPPTEFDADVAALARLIEECTAPGRLEGRFHPFLGRLSESEWLRWSYRHLDHHLRQFRV